MTGKSSSYDELPPVILAQASDRYDFTEENCPLDIDFTADDPEFSKKMGKVIHEITNRYREIKNLPLVGWSDSIFEVCEQHCKDICNRKKGFNHDGFKERVDACNIPPLISAENLFRHDTTVDLAKVARETVSWWVVDEPHRSNLISTTTISGTATVVRQPDGSFFSGQIFLRPKSDGNPEPTSPPKPTFASDFALRLVNKLNEIRIRNSLKPFEWNYEMAAMEQEHADAMAANKKITVEGGKERFLKVSFKSRGFGENVHATRFYGGDDKSFEDTLINTVKEMNSQKSNESVMRRKIENGEWENVGVGASVSSEDHRVYISLMFAKEKI